MKIIVEKYRKTEDLQDCENEFKKRRIQASEKRKTEIEHLENLIKGYEKMGLKTQIKMANLNIQSINLRIKEEASLNPAMFYPEITTKEMRIWEVWLPTRYTEYNWPKIEEYDFDRVPLEVLEEWNTAKELELFRTFTIRTPEDKKLQDPILTGIGLKDNKEYLIARWGESLKPFEEIKQVIEKYLKLKRMNKFLCELVGICSFMLVFALLAYFGLSHISGPDASSEKLGFLIFVCTFFSLIFAGLLKSLLKMQIFF